MSDEALSELATAAGLLPEWEDADGVAHIVLEVTDTGTPQLTSYRRIVLRVRSLTGE